MRTDMLRSSTRLARENSIRPHKENKFHGPAMPQETASDYFATEADRECMYCGPRDSQQCTKHELTLTTKLPVVRGGVQRQMKRPSNTPEWEGHAISRYLGYANETLRSSEEPSCKTPPGSLWAAMVTEYYDGQTDINRYDRRAFTGSEQRNANRMASKPSRKPNTKRQVIHLAKT